MNNESEPTVPERIPTPRRTTWSAVLDMVRSLVVIAVAAGVVLLILPNREEVIQPEVDLSKAALGAERLAGFRAVAPQLPQGWRVVGTRVDLELGAPTWVVSLMSPRGGAAWIFHTEQASDLWAKRAFGAVVPDADPLVVQGVRFTAFDRALDRPQGAWVWRDQGRAVAVAGNLTSAERSGLATAVVQALPAQAGSATPAAGATLASEPG